MKIKNKLTGEIIYTTNNNQLHPVFINSNLLSAQNRLRLYWSNIRVKKVGLFDELYTDIPQPKNEGILLRDILDKEVDEKYYIKSESVNALIKYNERQIENNRGFSAKFRDTDTTEKMDCLIIGGGGKDDLICVAIRGRGENNEQQLELTKTDKTNSLTSVRKDNLIMQINPSTESEGKQPYQQNRIYDTDGITPALCANKSDLLIRQKARGFNKGNDFKDKTPTLSSNSWEQNNLLHNNYRIRRLTPNECAKLQTIPAWYKWGNTSDTQIYRLLGNGWTNKIIVHILNQLK